MIFIVVGLIVALAVVMAFAWGVAMQTGKSGWADVFWSYGIGITGVVAIFASAAPGQGPNSRALLVAAILGLWSLRLGTHILGRTLSGGDDPRYAALKQQWGERFPLRLLGFLEIQAIVALLLVLSVVAASHNPAPLGWADILGVIVAIVAIVGEAISDQQLKAFAAKPQNHGKVCDVGLWGLSRHPNYFFEWLIWIAYVCIGVDLSGHYLWGYATLMAPIVMYWLLVHVSGVPPLEKHMLQSRGPAFRAYQAKVRAFWPIPKSAGANV